MSYWRDIGRSFVARVCGALDPTDPTSLVIPGPDPDEIAAFSEAVPPMRGAELLTPALLGDLWTDIGTALRVEVGRFKGGGTLVQDLHPTMSYGATSGGPSWRGSVVNPTDPSWSSPVPTHEIAAFSEAERRAAHARATWRPVVTSAQL